MTEIPEHLLKRAQAAREKAAEPAAEAAASAEDAGAAAGDSRIPAHLLSKYRCVPHHVGTHRYSPHGELVPWQ